MGVIERVAVIRNKLQPIRYVLDKLAEAAKPEPGVILTSEDHEALASVFQADQAFDEIVAELDALYGEAGGLVLGDRAFRHSEPPPESKL